MKSNPPGLIASWVSRVIHLNASTYIFFLTLGFYFLLWTINPGNKLLAASYVVLFLIYQIRLKNFRLSLLLTFLAASIVFTGKSYRIELVPPGIYPLEIFPEGYVLTTVISAQIILLFLIVATQVRDFIIGSWKISRPSFAEIILWVFTSWLIISDLFGSSRPSISLLFSSGALLTPFLYRFMKRQLHGQTALLLHLFAALIIVESTIALVQYFAGSPIYKQLESQVNIEYFGHVADEIQFSFRPVGTFSHTNEFGLWLSFWLILNAAYLYKYRSTLISASLTLGLISLVLTLSRSAWIGFGCGSLFCLYMLNKRAKISPPRLAQKYAFPLIFAAVIFLLTLILPRLEKTLYTFDEGGGNLRRQQMAETLLIIERHPIFGVGTRMLVVAGREQSPTGVFSKIALSVHNWYLLTAAEHGLPAALLFAIFIWQIGKKYLSHLLSLHSYRQTDIFKLGYVGGVLSLLIIGLFQPFIGETLIFTVSGILDPDDLEENHSL